MDKNKIMKFGLDLIELLMQDERFSFSEGDLQIFMEGFSAEDKELAAFVADANKVYNNSTDSELRGNYLVCKVDSGTNDKGQKQVRFNLDAFYSDLLKTDLNTVKERMALEILNLRTNMGFDDIIAEENYENFRSKLFIRALNFSRNYVRLENAVYDRFGDMAVCAYMAISHNSENGGEFLSAKLTKEILSKYGTEPEQAMTDAVINSRELYPERIYLSRSDYFDYEKGNKGYSLDEALSKVKSGEYSLNVPQATLVLTNEIHLNGAAAFFYEGVKEKIADIIGGDYYVVFISIHEVFIHPRNAFSPRMLKDTLYDTNSHFNNDENLTDKVFRYDARRKNFNEV